MGSVCAEIQHKFHHSHQLYFNKKIDIPPRKLLSRRSTAPVDFFMESPKAEAAIFRKFLPYNDDDDDGDPYSSDHFRMFEFKVRKCSRSRSHDWTDCPFAHPGEKARRRDPRKYNYTGTVCSEFRKGYCRKGDHCEFAHGVFECWLHPTRYRTEACKDGKNCKRKVCFFAHLPRQLRILPDNSPVCVENLHHCCVHCHSITNSPTSTLLGMSNLSPPVSPGPNSPGFSPVSRYTDRLNSGRMSYKDAMTELMSSFEAINVSTDTSNCAKNGNFPWIDVNFSIDEPTQFNLSPSTPSPSTKFLNGHSKFFRDADLMEDNKYNNEACLAGPDIGWVNDLLT
ncbi:Zinc finger CCCH domain-containing protein 2 [Forsythia ovata]|uniref:Zinc finger CCCH domain-containing protein 2 n=1 Tax=Forsythia ovata TaxID=205694 RepID=A0ABD1S7X1_9LAMI